MADNPLSTDNILKHMADALPTHAKDDTNSDMSSSYEAIGLFAHACMIAVDFRLVGFSEDEKEEAQIRDAAPRLLPKWNSSFGSHSFLYRHSQSSLKFLIKVDRLGSKAEIRAMGIEDEKINRFEVVAKDYISGSALPLRISINANGVEDRSDLTSKLKEIFISPSRIQDLASHVKTSIIQCLIPSLQKEGWEEQPANTAGASAARDARDEREGQANNRRNPAPPRFPADPPPARPHPFNDPLAADPRRPLPDGGLDPPGFDDEYDMNRRPNPLYMPGYNGGRSPFGIGGDDLNPPGLGPHDPLRGSFVGGGGGPGSGGMHPTFDDPLFMGGGRGQGRFDPQAPPGARYDPTGPGDPRFPHGGNGRPPNPFGGFNRDDFL